MNEIERQQYQDYTGRVIQYMEENGRNTYPMQRVCFSSTDFYDFLHFFHFNLGCR